MAGGLKPVISIDSGIIRGTGKPKNNRHTYRQIRRAVESENQTFYLPATMYEELGGVPSNIPSGTDWVDPLIKQGWVDVAPAVSGDPTASFSSPATQRGKWSGHVQTYFHPPQKPKTRFRNPEYFRW